MKPWVTKATNLLTNSLQPPQHELNELDWKGALSNDSKRLTEHLCAFSNYPGGGCFVFGVDANGNMAGIGLKEIEDIANKLSNLGRDAVEPALQLDHIGIPFQGSDLLFVHVPESSIKPVHRRGHSLEDTFIRSGGTTRKASRQEIGAMMLHSQTPRWEDLHVSNLLTDDELLDALDIDVLLNMLDQPIPTNPEERLRWMAGSSFIERHASGGGYITNLGAISAAKLLTSFPSLERKSIRVIVYEGLNKGKARSETTGQLGYALSFQRLVAFVCAQLPTSEVIEQALRQKTTVYPELALREIIANAIIHQDFTVSGAGPLIEIYDDRIEISNPGTLLPSKTLDRIIGTQPESRNEKLAGAFRMYKICEERGSGLVKAGIQIEVYGLPPIKFEQGSNHFKVTLFAPKTFAQMTAAERLNACYQHSLLRYLSSSVMTNKSLRERLKMPEKQRSMVSALIQEAIDMNLIAAANPENKSRKFAEYLPAWAVSHKG
ncbi:MAG TPA: ATP-binding protein [Acidobacteriaceae bacterium]